MRCRVQLRPPHAAGASRRRAARRYVRRAPPALWVAPQCWRTVSQGGSCRARPRAHRYRPALARSLQQRTDSHWRAPPGSSSGSADSGRGPPGPEGVLQGSHWQAGPDATGGNSAGSSIRPYMASILRVADQLVQQTETKGIVPVKVLEDRDDRLHAGLAQQQANKCLIRVLPMLGPVERLERMLLIERIEKIKHRRNRVMQRGVECQNFARHFLTDRSRAVMGADLEITPEQLDDRQIRRCATIRNGVGFQNQPVRCIVRMNELVHQTRFAHPRLADDRHHLTLTVAGKLLRAAELLQFDVAADEAS